MSHQSEIEKDKYRNWVKGGLAYKYLKQGLDDFADDVVKQEQNRILSSINRTPGTISICNQCIIERLQPLHACKTNSDGKYECPWGQRKCNCLHLNKKKCRLKVCDFIMEDILKSHGSNPPAPNWANTDIQKWCTEPWEVAKCFINAPGYSEKTKAADIDISGLLHVFINNTNLHSHLACSMTRKDIFTKVRKRRNKLFHSASMETEEGEVAECIDDIVEILEDPKVIRGRPEAQEAVNKLKQLKESKFVITTNDEADVCKEAIMCVTQKAEKLKQMIEEVKDFNERVQNNETNMSEKVEELTKDLYKRIEKVESDVFVLKSDVSAVKERVTSLENKVRELDSKRDIYKRHLDYVKWKQELQGQLVKYYMKHDVKTSLSPLKQQQDTINIKDVYVTPEIEVMEEEKCVDIDKHTTEKPAKRYIQEYHEIFQTKGQRHKKVYILGDVGTGKSAFCKMMIKNWCNAVSGRTNESVRNENDLERPETVSSDMNMANGFDDVCQMGQYEFLFLIPLQYMSGLKSDDIVDMIKELTRHLTSDTDLIDRIFQKDSKRCLIIIDSLDEWTPPKNIVRTPHVSHGIPNGVRAKNATVLTLSRPSAKGILNLKNSEFDLKSHLLGISSSSLKSFIEQYISNTASTKKSYNEFITIMKRKEVGHIEKTPLLLQQILWLYCNDMELGKSVSETYCQILNIMCGWSDHKVDGNDVRNDAIGDKNIFLPEIMQRYPRFRNNKRVFFLTGATAFDILTSSSITNIFGRHHLLKNGLSEDEVTKLLKFGIFKESNCFDPTQEDTQFSFIHMSYLEFFAALYVSSNNNLKETKCLREKEDEKQEVLDKLLSTCKSASDILQLSNVIKMVCGLSPILIGDLSKRISCIVNEDAHILHLRRHGYKKSFRNDEIIQIQRLLVICLKECGSFDKTMISISDLCINVIEPSPCLQRINTNDVISLSFEETTSKNVVDYMTQCKQLQHIYIKHVSFSNKQFSFLSQLVCVKQLALRGVNIADTLQSGTIDLSSQKQLQILELISCMNIRIYGLVTEHLEQVYIEDCPNVLDFKLLSNAITLTELYIETHSRLETRPQLRKFDNIDMSRQNHLRKLSLINPGIVITGLNVGQLEQVNIQYINVDQKSYLSYSSKNMELQVKDLTISEATLLPLLQKTTLRQVTLDKVRCKREKHLHVDLSGQNNLQKLTLVESPVIVITGLNPELLQHIHIDNSIHYRSSRASITALQNELQSSSRKIIELNLCGQTVNTKTFEVLQQRTLRRLTMKHVSGDKHEIHLNLSQQNHLQILKLSDCKQIKISGLNTEELKKVHVINCKCVFDFGLSTNASKLSEIHLERITGNMTSLVSLVEHASLRTMTLEDVTHCQSDDEKEMHESVASRLNKFHVDSIIGNMAPPRRLTLKSVTHCQPDIEGQTHEIPVDLSKQNHLEIFTLSNCKNMKIIGLNIEQLTLIGDTHCQSECEGQTHEIHVDISKQNHLQIFTLLDNKIMKISDIKTELKWIQRGKYPGILNIELLGNARRLTKLIFTGHVLDDRYQFRKQGCNVIHTLHRLKTLILKNVDMDANALTLIPEMVFLTSILLQDTKMSVDTWRAFVDSILTLRQSVVTYVSNTKVFDPHLFANAEEEMKYHYVKDNPLFIMIEDNGALCFCFQWRKPERRI